MQSVEELGAIAFPEADHRADRCAHALREDRKKLIEEVKNLIRCPTEPPCLCCKDICDDLDGLLG